MTLQLLVHAEYASIHVATLVACMTRQQCVSPRSKQALKQKSAVASCLLPYTPIFQ